MMDIVEPRLTPPRWARAVLLFALPCDSMRDAILGDLHEEFLDDATECGPRSARARYVRRAAGIVVRAAYDALIWREWVSADPVATEPPAVVKSAARSRAAGSFASFVAVALVVLGAAVVVNTMLFSANQARGPHGLSAAGIGGVVLLVACVGIGAVIVCAGPRWRRNRRRGV